MDNTSQNGHYAAGNNLGQYHSNPFVVGGATYNPWSENNKVEVLESLNGNLEWKLKQDYPYESR